MASEFESMMANASAYRGTEMAHRSNDAYAGNDPYAKSDPHAKQKEQVEKKGIWELEYSILRFFREMFNAGVDFEETPKAFFDEEHIMSMRLRVFSKNVFAIFMKIILMSMFLLIAFILPEKMVFLFGFIYIILFFYFLTAPIAFYRYAKQYIIDESEKGKLFKVYKTYGKWVKPLETIGVNITTFVFLAIQIFLYFNIQTIQMKALTLLSKHDVKIEWIIHLISKMKTNEIQHSLIIVMIFMLVTVLIHKLFLYGFWSKKWENVQKENMLFYKRTNQRVAKNLKDELIGDDI